MSHPHTYDLLIIGAGPAGLACAIEARNAGMSYLVADKGGIVDSIQRYQREMYFFSTPELLEIGGVPFVVPSTRPTTLDCVNYYRSVADHYALHASFYDAVLSAVKEGERFMLRMSGGGQHHARAVVVATGYYGTPNPLDVPGERLPHVSHYYRDPPPYYGQRVLVGRGKRSACDARPPGARVARGSKILSPPRLGKPARRRVDPAPVWDDRGRIPAGLD